MKFFNPKDKSLMTCFLMLSQIQLSQIYYENCKFLLTGQQSKTTKVALPVIKEVKYGTA